MFTVLFYSLVAVIFLAAFATLLHDEVSSAFYLVFDLLSGGQATPHKG